MAVRASGTRARARALLVWSVVFALLTTCCAVDVGKSSGKSSGKLTDKLFRKRARGGKTCAKRDLGAHSDLARQAEEAAASADCDLIAVVPEDLRKAETDKCKVLEGYVVKTAVITNLKYPGIDSCVSITFEFVGGGAVGAHFVHQLDNMDLERQLFDRLVEAVPPDVQVKKVYVDGDLDTWYTNADCDMMDDYFTMVNGPNHGDLTSNPQSIATSPGGGLHNITSCALRNSAAFETMVKAKLPNPDLVVQFGDCQGDLEIRGDGAAAANQVWEVYFKKNGNLQKCR